MANYILRYKYLIFLSFFLSILLGIMDVGKGIILKEIIDTAITNNNSGFLRIIVVIVLFILSNIALYASFQRLSLLIASYICKDIKNDLIGNIINKSDYDNMEFISTVNKDVDMIYEKKLINLFMLVRTMSSFVLSLGYLIYVNIYIAMSVVACGLISIYLPSLFVNKSSELKNVYIEATAQFFRMLKELLYGIETIKLFMLENEYLIKLNDSNKKVEESRLRSNFYDDCIQLLVTSNGFLILSINVVLAAFLSHKGYFSIGTALAIMQVMNYVILPINQGPFYIAEMNSIYPIEQKILGILEKVTYEKTLDKEKVLQEEIKTIEIKNLSYCYPGSQSFAIENLDLLLERGKKYVLLGSSGSGKSTLLKVLTKLNKAYSGKIEIDGEELSDIDEISLRKKINFVQQNPYIFQDTLEFNICLRHDVEKKELDKVIELVNLKELIRKLPNGVKTVLSDNGNNLSGGEKQKIAIARVFIREPEIIFVDEGMSALDTKNTYFLENMFLKYNGTIVTISHKSNPQILKQYDQIVVMENSRIVAVGNFNQVAQSPYSYLLNV
ncbi:ATP-binding cassette subfamily C protein [Oribacterium sinus]|uniref:ATP-binding cassette subfamily C protein n=1 Tax=Oribacterium sinus TaxID=237576 RepID=A0A7W9SG80_9FIRM|nr:ABC transporter ATP-binding protein [Oribacterium sinus]MBB6041559.1 ATP-binding cassette subfamily C protein [Oribacterium sinus]